MRRPEEEPAPTLEEIGMQGAGPGQRVPPMRLAVEVEDEEEENEPAAVVSEEERLLWGVAEPEAEDCQGYLVTVDGETEMVGCSDHGLHLTDPFEDGGKTGEEREAEEKKRSAARQTAFVTRLVVRLAGAMVLEAARRAAAQHIMLLAGQVAELLLSDRREEDGKEEEDAGEPALEDGEEE